MNPFGVKPLVLLASVSWFSLGRSSVFSHKETQRVHRTYKYCCGRDTRRACSLQFCSTFEIQPPFPHPLLPILHAKKMYTNTVRGSFFAYDLVSLSKHVRRHSQPKSILFGQLRLRYFQKSISQHSILSPSPGLLVARKKCYVIFSFTNHL